MKDAQGHGSNSRGGSYPNIDKNLRGPGKHVGYANGAWRITKLGSGYLATHSQTGESFRGDSLGHVSDQLAARALASGPKSSPVPTHNSMASRGSVINPANVTVSSDKFMVTGLKEPGRH